MEFNEYIKDLSDEMNPKTNTNTQKMLDRLEKKEPKKVELKEVEVWIPEELFNPKESYYVVKPAKEGFNPNDTDHARWVKATIKISI